MAHKYSNFADAFTANRAKFGMIKTNRQNAYDLAGAVWTHALKDEWRDAFYDTKRALFALAACIYLLVDCEETSYEQSHYYESFYWAAQEPKGAVITMRAILDEMFAASNYELMQFIGLVDAYRQSLWNKPFNRELWAAYARGFEEWE